MLQSRVAGGGRAARGAAYDLYAGIGAGAFVREPRGRVGRAVIDDDRLPIGVGTLSEINARSSVVAAS